MPAIKQEPPSPPSHTSPYSLRQRRKPPTWHPSHSTDHPSAPARNAARTAKKEACISTAAPTYSDEDQATLTDARFTVQEAEVTAALVKELGLFPVQKKKHGRRNAARARSVLARLDRIDAWGGGETARAVAMEVGMWRQALGACGWERWDVSDDEYRRRGRAGVEELLGEVRAVKEGVQGEGEGRVRALAKRYLMVFHLLSCGAGLEEAQGVEMEVIRGQMAMLPTGTERAAEDVLAEEAALLCGVIINGPGGVKRAEP